MNGTIQTPVFRDEIQCLIRDFMLMIRQYPPCVSLNAALISSKFPSCIQDDICDFFKQ